MRRTILICGAALLLARPTALHAVEAPGIDVEDLRCEYREEPLGIDAAKPRLSWILRDRGHDARSRGQRQTAYQVLVASTPALLADDKGDLWDSGRVESDEQNQIEYSGNPLASRNVCHWKVRVWDRDGTPSAWSRPAVWSMGLLEPEDWHGRWIGCGQPSPSGDPSSERKSLVIRKAVYRTVDGSVSQDVTGRVAGLVRDNRLQMFVSNQTLGGDVAPGRVKLLAIDYQIDGIAGTQQWPETREVMLPPPSSSAEEVAWASPRYLRKEFVIDARPVRRATAYVTALGLYELRLNGQRVGDQLLAPEWTDYRKRVQYQTYDVTGQVKSGANAVSAIVGNGWFAGGWQHWQKQLKPIYGTEPFLLAQLEIEFADGTCERVVTDHSWRGTADGPLQLAGIYEGVSYDARKAMPGWDAPGFDDTGWKAAVTHSPTDDAQVGRLVWQRNEPIRATRELKPVALAEPQPGVYVFAFDQNIVGHCRISLRGKAGQTVELQYGEMRNLDGTVFTGNLCVVSQHRAQLDRYTFRGEGVETFEPCFTYHGFQYVEVRGLTEKPRLEDVTGVVFNSDCPESGEFTCSDPLLNRLARNILWSQRGNFMGVPTDCPQRNERCGYTGDAQFFMRAAVFNMNVAAFFAKWLMDVEDAQQPDGHFADHAPTFGPGNNQNIGWADAGIICPYEIYRTYGDTRVIREHYAAMKRYLDYLTSQSKDFLYVGKVGNGDWLNTGGAASKEVIGTAFMAFDFRLMAEMAEAIGENEDAAAFRDRFEKIAAAFAKAYLGPDGGIKDSSLTGYAMAFTMGLVPRALAERMSERFSAEVRRFKWHPRTGFIGTPRLLPGLHLAGRDDDAYKLLLMKTAPSWLYPVSVGATTIWEHWTAWDGVHPRGGMVSLNHYAFGSVGEYLFGMVGGIQPAAPGYERITIAPVIGDDLTWANTRYDSVRGRIATVWKIVDGKIELEVTIPVNATATVHVPAADGCVVTENGKPAEQSAGVRMFRSGKEERVFEIGSGSYRFVSVVPATSGAPTKSLVP